MLFHSRHRRGSYPLAPESPVPSLLRWAALSLGILIALYLAGAFFLRFFGVGNPIRHSPAVLSVEGRGTVNVLLDEGELQRAQDGMKLYAGDKVTTGKGAHATLRFFDGSFARLDEQTELQITESVLGTRESTLDLALNAGVLWISVPSPKSFTGSISRVVETPFATYALTAATEALLSPMRASVFAGEGQGVEITLRGVDSAPIFIGEGQKIDFPDKDGVGGDLYAYRTAIDPVTAIAPFVEESRLRKGSLTRTAATKENRSATEDVLTGFLTIRTPAQNERIASATVKVEGVFGEGVTHVKVNEYDAILAEDSKTFSQEIALPAGIQEFDVAIVAMSAVGDILEETHRTVRREFKAPDSPTITSPANQGRTWRTGKEELVLRGKAPAGAVGIIVNDYRLQLFSPSKGEWSYLASTRLGNYAFGENTFSVVAIDVAGNKSEPSVLNIILGEGAEGVVEEEGIAGGVSSTPQKLPENAPLKTGSLAVTGPTAGSVHTATGSEFLIEGRTDALTVGVWVNDYRLQLYTPGTTTWNYIANAAFGNLKAGKNIYAITARNAKNEILDTVEYTVMYRP